MTLRPTVLAALALTVIVLAPTAGYASCRWVSRGLKSYLKCSGDVAKALGSLTGQLQDKIGKPVSDTVLRPLDRARLEFGVQTTAPALAEWIRKSRDDAVNAGVFPIPAHIYQKLKGGIDEEILQKVRYRGGSGHDLGLPRFALHLGHRDAITLGHVVVFRNNVDADSNLALWVHELVHVKQYHHWGIDDFAKRYIRSWTAIENDAVQKESDFDHFRNAPDKLFFVRLSEKQDDQRSLYQVRIYRDRGKSLRDPDAIIDSEYPLAYLTMMINELGPGAHKINIEGIETDEDRGRWHFQAEIVRSAGGAERVLCSASGGYASGVRRRECILRID